MPQKWCLTGVYTLNAVYVNSLLGFDGQKCSKLIHKGYVDSFKLFDQRQIQ